MRKTMYAYKDGLQSHKQSIDRYRADKIMIE